MDSNRMFEIVESVKRTIIHAGSLIMEIYRMNEYESLIKEDLSPITIADTRSNRFICDQLKRIDPTIPIISEENIEISFEYRKSFDYHWMIDPLDGTKEFIGKTDEFSINISLMYRDKPVIGMVYTPVFKDLYWAVKNEGAFRSLNGGKTESIKVNTFTLKDKRLRVVCSRSHLNKETKEYIHQFESPVTIPKGSALKFLIIADGRADIYPRLGSTMEWDTAAPQLIVEEAGGQIVDIKSGKALVYNKESLLNPHFLATGKILS